MRPMWVIVEHSHQHNFPVGDHCDQQFPLQALKVKSFVLHLRTFRCQCWGLNLQASVGQALALSYSLFAASCQETHQTLTVISISLLDSCEWMWEQGDRTEHCRHFQPSNVTGDLRRQTATSQKQLKRLFANRQTLQHFRANSVAEKCLLSQCNSAGCRLVQDVTNNPRRRLGN